MNNKFQLLNEGLIINKISKSFGSKQVVREISLTLKRGQIVGLLGPNGAGKTTTFYIYSKTTRSKLYLLTILLFEHTYFIRKLVWKVLMLCSCRVIELFNLSNSNSNSNSKNSRKSS